MYEHKPPTFNNYILHTVYLWVSYDSQNKQRLFTNSINQLIFAMETNALCFRWDWNWIYKDCLDQFYRYTSLCWNLI
jgi:hypothetical protein